ncbi:MAG: hypothetical protein II393_04005 [Cytophagales bacterium]|nr:hypothetical protein [Cytophagales bacterium]
MNIEKLMEMLKGDKKEEKVEEVFERTIKDAKGVAKGFSAFVFVTDKQTAIYGTGAEVLALLASVINDLGEKGLPKEEIQKVIDVAYMDDEELEKEAKKCEKKAKESLKKFKEMLGELEEEDENE